MRPGLESSDTKWEKTADYFIDMRVELNYN